MRIDIQHITFAGLPAIRLIGSKGDQATLMLRGGQLVSWINAHGEEMLYVSPFADVVPEYFPEDTPAHTAQMVFPQFSQPQAEPRNGFARSVAWTFHDAWFHLGVPNVSLRLKSNPATKAVWPHDFDCFLHVAVNSPGLSMTLEVINTGTRTLEFNAASHPYLRVEDSANALLLGMPKPREGMVIAKPIDRIEFAENGPNELVCVRDATVVRRPIALAPGHRWSASQTMYWVPHWAQSRINA